MAHHLPELKRGDVLTNGKHSFTVASVDPHGKRSGSRFDEPRYRLAGKIGTVPVVSKTWHTGEAIALAGYRVKEVTHDGGAS